MYVYTEVTEQYVSNCKNLCMLTTAVYLPIGSYCLWLCRKSCTSSLSDSCLGDITLFWPADTCAGDPWNRLGGEADLDLPFPDRHDDGCGETEWGLLLVTSMLPTLRLLVDSSCAISLWAMELTSRSCAIALSGPWSLCRAIALSGPWSLTVLGWQLYEMSVSSAILH